MNPVQSVPPLSIPYASPAPALVPAASAAPAVSGLALPVDSVTIGSTGIAETDTYQRTAIELAQATPQELAHLAGNGNSHAREILAQKAAVQKLLSPAGLTA